MANDAFWMWTQACEVLDRADRLQRQFFRPDSRSGGRWEPPVDVLETAEAVWVMVALPGVSEASIGLAMRGSDLLVTGSRTLPASLRRAVLHRLEIPTGHFERLIPLPPGHYQLAQQNLENGCLTLVLQKVSAYRSRP